MNTIYLPLAAALLLPHALDAQSPQDFASQGAPQATTMQAQAWLQSATVQRVDGELWAVQADWKASFTTEGVTFTPVLGADAPVSLPVRFSFVDAGRGSGDGLAREGKGPATDPTLDDKTVSYRHGDGIRELYEVRDEGLKHSVVFAERPEGSGDLRVRVALESDLAAPAGTYTDGLVLRDGARDVVGIGAVVGIDARGRQRSGWLEFDGSYLDLVLPAAFVDSASYPLTLDPLIGSLAQIGPSGSVWYPDVAYDVTNDLYLVVWERTTAVLDRDVLGQRIRADGTPVGNPVLIDTNGNDDYAPRVASVNVRDAFYVVWEFDNHYSGSGPSREVWGRAVRAVDGVMGSKLNIQDAINSPVVGMDEEGFQPDVCGERTTADDECLVVYIQPEPLPTLPEKKGVVSQEVTIAANLDSNLITSRLTQLSSDVSARNPRISNSGGSGRVAVVAWEASPLIVLRAISMNSALRSANFAFGAASRPSIDGNGTDFLLAYQRPNSSNDDDIWIRGFTVPSSASSSMLDNGAAPYDADPNQDVEFPSLALVQDGPSPSVQYYAIGHNRVFNNPARADSYIGRVTGSPQVCGPRDLVKTFSSFSNVTSTYAGGRDNDDRGMVVIHDGFRVWAQGFEAFGNGGPIVNIGGGCGQGGTLTAEGPMALGNRDWGLRLTGAASTMSILAVDLSLAPSAPIFPCNACRALLPTFTVDVPLANGQAFVPIPVTCDPNWLGRTLRWQFWTLTPGTPPTCYWGRVSCSNILETTHGR
ncbi:MAG: hypothetical protein IPM29_17355 [Planctomycetes bacterium]|nr:hypothetical protein [Planctomycetota bacterium]